MERGQNKGERKRERKERKTIVRSRKERLGEDLYKMKGRQIPNKSSECAGLDSTSPNNLDARHVSENKRPVLFSTLITL